MTSKLFGHIRDSRSPVTRLLAAMCILLWLIQFSLMGDGSYAQAFTRADCPHDQTQHAQHSPNHCLTHCQGIESHGCTAPLRGPAVVTGWLVLNLHRSRVASADFTFEMIPRGPPLYIEPENVSDVNV